MIGNTVFSSPTPHSLRHSFAVNTLKCVKERGRSAQNALPVLAAYMGHSEYKHTIKYLKFLDELDDDDALDTYLNFDAHRSRHIKDRISKKLELKEHSKEKEMALKRMELKEEYLRLDQKIQFLSKKKKLTECLDEVAAKEGACIEK